MGKNRIEPKHNARNRKYAQRVIAALMKQTPVFAKVLPGRYCRLSSKRETLIPGRRQRVHFPVDVNPLASRRNITISKEGADSVDSHERRRWAQATTRMRTDRCARQKEREIETTPVVLQCAVPAAHVSRSALVPTMLSSSTNSARSIAMPALKSSWERSFRSVVGVRDWL